MTSDDYSDFLRRNFERYEEIKHLAEGRVRFVKSAYAHTVYSVRLDDETRKLSDHDLVILCDRGNACFGGHVAPRFGEEVRVDVYTD